MRGRLHRERRHRKINQQLAATARRKRQRRSRRGLIAGGAA